MITGTSWKTDDVSKKFNSYNDMLEEILGYNFIFKRIGSVSNIVNIIDFGCGPGKVAERLSQINDKYHIIAVDESEKMLKIANDQHKNAQIDYKLIKNDSLDFLPSQSIDCAIMCFVIINNANADRIYRMVHEIYRVLRPSGLFAILDSNPEILGVQFTTFKNGEKGKKYKNGDPKQQILHIPNCSDLILNDFYWSKEFYHELLSTTGFKKIRFSEPVLSNLSREELKRQF